MIKPIETTGNDGLYSIQKNGKIVNTDNLFKYKLIKIESVQERIICLRDIPHETGVVMTMEDALSALSNTLRHPLKHLYITALKGANPAFEYWVDKLRVGEKLPRGKYFKSCEFIR